VTLRAIGNNQKLLLFSATLNMALLWDDMTTGELKTRGTYFEENALLPSLIQASLEEKDHVSSQEVHPLLLWCAIV